MASRREMIPGLVSTVVPVYNRPALMEEAVRSVLAQTYRPIEIILVDDGSNEATAHAVDELARQNAGVVRVVHRPNGGPGCARETGRSMARGEFIQYLDSDDLMLPRKLEVQVSALREHPECGIAYGVTRLIDESGIVLDSSYKGSGERRETLFPALLVERWWNTHTPLYRRSVCDAVGPWTDMRTGEDWEYDARVGALGTRLTFCDEYVSEHRQHDGPRLTGKTSISAQHARDWTRLLPILADCAVAAGIAFDTPEMQHLARRAFLLARQTGAVGFVKEARELFALARRLHTAGERHSLQLTVYGIAAYSIGWTAVGRLAARLERLSERPSRQANARPRSADPQ